MTINKSPSRFCISCNFAIISDIFIENTVSTIHHNDDPKKPYPYNIPDSHHSRTSHLWESFSPSSPPAHHKALDKHTSPSQLWQPNEGFSVGLRIDSKSPVPTQRW